MVITAPNLPKPQQKAVQMLIEEVQKRTQIRWLHTNSTEGLSGPAVIVGESLEAEKFAASLKVTPPPLQGRPPEGYAIWTSETPHPIVWISGNDSRGVLFGVGRLLRELRMGRQEAALQSNLRIVSSPSTSLRGHQLGYRPKCNSYDGWHVALWEQYIRDLVVFGCNAIELIPPRSDDEPDSPHFPLPQMEMMIEMSRLASEYDLDVWAWYPALDEDYSDPKTVEFALREWGEVLRKLPRLDAVFVPGGDPGRTTPKVLFQLLEKQTANLRRFHPRAQMWVSPQSFNQERLEEFVALVKEEPSWLSGIVHGPQVRVSLAELRRLIPARYPLRDYPDITHTTHCQFVVPDWDLAFMLTYYREPINPRPAAMKTIFSYNRPHTRGFITYSEGCNDDVNKIVWSALGWNPGADVTEILREYSRYFIGTRFETNFAQGLLALENNWRGALATNTGVEQTLEQFQEMERAALPSDLLNWRFQMALYRAYYDAYIRRRLLHDRSTETKALAALRDVQPISAFTAFEQAEGILDIGASTEVAAALRLRIFQLAEALFQSVRMQLSVARYGAISRDRGATLDNLDAPLNNRSLLKRKLSEIGQVLGREARAKAAEQLANWSNPGPGGFYDDLGDPLNQPHLVSRLSFDDDPDHLRHPLLGVARHPWTRTDWRLSWLSNAESMFDSAVELHYSGLDRTAQYKVRVIYGGEPSPTRLLRLTANNAEVHPFRRIENLTEPQEVDIPQSATRGGNLRLTWTRQPGLGGSGRGCQIAEVWLIRK